MTLALRTQTHSAPQLTHTISEIESCLVDLKAELAFLENRLNQTRQEYHRVLHHLEEVKTQLARQESLSGLPLSSNEVIHLEPDGDADWEHLITQIASL